MLSHGMLPIGWLLLIPLAAAGVAADVPAGETRVDLVVCPTDEPCATKEVSAEFSTADDPNWVRARVREALVYPYEVALRRLGE